MTSLFKKNKYSEKENGTDDDCCIPRFGRKGMSDVMKEDEEEGEYFLLYQSGTRC